MTSTNATHPKPAGGRTGRPPRMAPSRRDAILDAALKVFIVKGVSGTAMAEVAERAGASKATLYKFFASTGELFEAMFVREVVRRRGGISQALQNADLAEALRSAVRAMLAALDERAIEIFRLVISEAGRTPEVGRHFYSELVGAAAQPIGARLADALELDPDAAQGLALQLVGVVKEPVFYPRLMGVPVLASPEPLIERAVSITLDGIRPSDRT